MIKPNFNYLLRDRIKFVLIQRFSTTVSQHNSGASIHIIY